MNPFNPVGLIAQIINIYIYIIIADVIISWLLFARVSWIRPYHPIVRGIQEAAGLLVNPIRRILNPWSTGGIDFSPLIAIVLLEIVQRLFFSLY
ncbi:MAG: YggT family protein [Armatimonadetes bacterium]|nr:YggT family protein [Armatimonadota bacterium]